MLNKMKNILFLGNFQDLSINKQRHHKLKQLILLNGFMGYHYEDVNSVLNSTEPVVLDFLFFWKSMLISSLIFLVIFLCGGKKKDSILILNASLFYMIFLLWVLKYTMSLYKLFNYKFVPDLMMENPEVFVSSGQLLMFAFFVVMIIITFLLLEVKHASLVEDLSHKWKDIMLVFHLNLIFMLVFFFNMPTLILTLESLSLTTAILLLSRCTMSVESVIKYFVASSLSTSIMVTGISIIFWKEQTLSYDEMSYLFHKVMENTDEGIPVLDLYIMMLISTGFMLKLGLFPYHAWAMDVFNGLSTNVLFYLSVPYKLVVLMVSLKFFNMLGFFTSTHLFSVYLMYFLILGCLFLGNMGAWSALSFNRFISFTSLNNLGYFFILCFTNEPQLMTSVVIYIFMYAISSGMFFLTLLSYDLRPTTIEDIFKEAPNLYCFTLLTVSLLSLAGMPPFGGFWGKMFLISSLYMNQHYFLLLSIVLSSAISIVYYVSVLFPMWTSGVTLLLLKSYPQTSFVQFMDVATKVNCKQLDKIPSPMKMLLAAFQDMITMLLVIMMMLSMFYLTEIELGCKTAGLSLIFYKWQQSGIHMPDVILNAIEGIFLSMAFKTFKYIDPSTHINYLSTLEFFTHKFQSNKMNISTMSMWVDVFKNNGAWGVSSNTHLLSFLCTETGQNFMKFMHSNYQHYMPEGADVSTHYKSLYTFWNTVFVQLSNYSLYFEGGRPGTLFHIPLYMTTYFIDYNLDPQSYFIHNFASSEVFYKLASIDQLQFADTPEKVEFKFDALNKYMAGPEMVSIWDKSLECLVGPLPEEDFSRKLKILQFMGETFTEYTKKTKDTTLAPACFGVESLKQVYECG